MSGAEEEFPVREYVDAFMAEIRKGFEAEADAIAYGAPAAKKAPLAQQLNRAQRRKKP